MSHLPDQIKRKHLRCPSSNGAEALGDDDAHQQSLESVSNDLQLLQSALWYIEAIHSKAPRFAEKERRGLCIRSELESDERLGVADEAELARPCLRVMTL